MREGKIEDIIRLIPSAVKKATVCGTQPSAIASTGREEILTKMRLLDLF
jgi:hypothetical protein